MARMITIDEQRCMGCKTCLLECAMAHSDAASLAEAIGLAQRPQPRLYVEPLGRFGLPLQCRHCDDAPCLVVCPTQAIHRPAPDGPVLLEAARCIGCRFCMTVCPFGVIERSRGGKAMIKCDLCVQRTQAGQMPACVASCPTGALAFEEVEAYLRRRRREAGAQIVAGSQKARAAESEGGNGR